MTTTETATEGRKTQLPDAGPETIPTLPTAVKDAKATRELMFTLRHFHLGDPASKEKLETVGDDCLPAVLDPFRDTSRLRYDYPLFLFPPDAEKAPREAEELACPLSHWLQEAAASFAAGKDEARVLKDHAPWLEHHVRQLLHDREGPVSAAATLAESCHALGSHLKLSDADQQRLEKDLESLLKTVPKGAQLLGYGRYPALFLLLHAIRSQVLPRRVRFQDRIDECVRALKELIEVEWAKSDESIEPKMARDSVGPAGALFDPGALSAVMDHSRGSQILSQERRGRIEQALEILESWEPDPVLVRFVQATTLTNPWLNEADFCEQVTDSNPCARAMDIFDREAETLTAVFGALRIARLEIDGIYDAATHNPWFANFNWEAFSQDELSLVPSLIALESADHVAGDGMRSFSRLLSSGRPVQILIRVQAHNNPGAGADEDPFQSFRTELGYLGISHRQAAVDQSSAARHQHLLSGYLAALDATRTSLHLINTGLRHPSKLVPLNAWLVAGAAIESRAHPFFRINPEAGDYSALRMDFEGNPQPDLDWSVHPFHYRDENGNSVSVELAFTFADYALLIERLREHFRFIPPDCDSPALVPMQEYLAMEPEQAYQRVPFVWAVDGNALLHRVVVSRELALASLDRLNYWRTLQEMAGVRNRYVDMAVEQTQTEERQQAKEERERLQAAHAEELEKVRREAAGDAMQRLTDVLLGMDLSSGMPGAFMPTAAGAARKAEAPPVEAEPTAQEQPTAAAEEEDEFSFDEPWIDTPLCTSCNDCLKVNPLLFVYNEEKQALLGDVGSATFAQLVEAAELCPAKCIHPGKPLNPDEPGLDDLIERAAPFNQ
jgi:ferredoxin